jgi:hypothetical protein
LYQKCVDLWEIPPDILTLFTTYPPAGRDNAQHERDIREFQEYFRNISPDLAQYANYYAPCRRKAAAPHGAAFVAETPCIKSQRRVPRMARRCSQSLTQGPDKTQRRRRHAQFRAPSIR